MKTLLFSLLIVVFSTMVFAQEVDDRIVVNKKDLPPDLVEQLEGKKDFEKYAEYVGVGKEIGIAISEGLKAVVDQAEHFSGTNVGLFTMALIGWAIIGKDVVQIIIGVPIFFIGLFLIIRYYRKTFLPNKILVQREGFFLWGKRTYQVADSKIRLEAFHTFVVFLCCLVWVGICMAIIFS